MGQRKKKENNTRVRGDTAQVAYVGTGQKCSSAVLIENVVYCWDNGRQCKEM